MQGSWWLIRVNQLGEARRMKDEKLSLIYIYVYLKDKESSLKGTAMMWHRRLSKHFVKYLN